MYLVSKPLSRAKIDNIDRIFTIFFIAQWTLLSIYGIACYTLSQGTPNGS
jgi:hypothetical protein